MKKPLLLVTAAAALIATVAPAVHAAEKEGAAKPAPAKMTAEQQADLQRSAMIFRLFNSAFTSKEVQQPVKAKLLTCLYGNSLGNISVATGRAIKENGLDEKKMQDVYRAAAGVCGIAFKPVDGAAAKPAPKSSGNNSSGEGR
ncbi:hypothetical protein H0274_03655 [Altererythrobacter sp. CC-YST694]|uniref:hypothetical protein n=1 Tax=Altererythrobacter sp. CC-YST694 TaxID=2755038 RepID=UPI001D00A769|nr:hypothetical protein [Altererythrobacter sp. CC-YST694]MCB5424344.1 hypothetical protein [Altererythrobacter sp. CC-YST694]